MIEIRERRAVMALPKLRLALWQVMLGIAILAVCLALFRLNIALGVIAACVSCLSLARTARIMRACEVPAGRVSLWRLLNAGLDSFVVSCCIIGAGDIIFLLVYGLAESILSSGGCNQPDPGALIAGTVSGLVVSYLVRRRVWDRRAKPEHLC